VERRREMRSVIPDAYAKNETAEMHMRKKKESKGEKHTIID
jgi:hypothetical protein